MRAGVQTADTTEFLTLQAPKAKICLKVNNEKMTSLNFQKFYTTSARSQNIRQTSGLIAICRYAIYKPV